MQLQKREPEVEVFHAHELNADGELLLLLLRTSPTPTSCSAMSTRQTSTLTRPEIKTALTMFARTDGPPSPCRQHIVFTAHVRQRVMHAYAARVMSGEGLALGGQTFGPRK
jgi:hypothetical protein